MPAKRLGYLLACCALLAGLFSAARAGAQKKDYLSPKEADSVRDADTPSDRIKLFISFAGDRIKKLQYELEHASDNVHPAERINAMIINYSNCMDDAADLIDLSTDKQQDVRPAIKEMQARAPEFLNYLKGLQAQGVKMQEYKENLDDAVDSTNDAMKTADEALQQAAPPPVRRNAK